jgi:hypothetical protein
MQRWGFLRSLNHFKFKTFVLHAYLEFVEIEMMPFSIRCRAIASRSDGPVVFNYRSIRFHARSCAFLVATATDNAIHPDSRNYPGVSQIICRFAPLCMKRLKKFLRKAIEHAKGRKCSRRDAELCKNPNFVHSVLMPDDAGDRLFVTFTFHKTNYLRWCVGVERVDERVGVEQKTHDGNHSRSEIMNEYYDRLNAPIIAGHSRFQPW